MRRPDAWRATLVSSTNQRPPILSAESTPAAISARIRAVFTSKRSAASLTEMLTISMLPQLYRYRYSCDNIARALVAPLVALTRRPARYPLDLPSRFVAPIVALNSERTPILAGKP